MTAGAPTKYKPDYCIQLVEFFSKNPYSITTEHITGKNWEKEDTKLIPNEFPTFEKFAASIDVDEDTLRNWRDEFPEFFGAYKKAKMLQKNFLIQNGLNGLYPAAAFCFVAKNCTDMRDKTEIEHSGTVSIAQQITEAYGK